MSRKLKFRNKEQLERRQDLAITFSTDAGKRVLEDFEQSFGGDCYTKGDPYDTAFREGQRNVLLRIKQGISDLQCEIEIEEEQKEVL
jgi:hypothetical protein